MGEDQGNLKSGKAGVGERESGKDRGGESESEGASVGETSEVRVSRAWECV